MINIIKSTPPPLCLEKEKKKANGDYKCGDVLERIKNDFYNKCYICEYKEPPSINVEHFLPHKGDRDLKFDWNNLFWACVHCNSTKGLKFDNILNCTNPKHDVEKRIKYEIIHFPKKKVKITALDDSKIVDKTVQLLHEVYNGTTRLKIIESSNIRETLGKEIHDFLEQLEEYYDKNIEDADREYYFNKIKRHLKKSSAFTAFKRWITKENSDYRKDFEQYLD